MDQRRNLQIVVSVVSLFLFLLLLSTLYLYFRRRMVIRNRSGASDGESLQGGESFELAKAEAGNLVVFSGCEHLKTQDILDAPGEVIGKSSYGTLYRATVRSSTAGDPSPSVMLLRFVHPDCAGRSSDVLSAVHLIGCLQHPNLVPLRALYVGPKGEKLFVYPFYAAGNLSQFLNGGTAETRKWKDISKICLGIAKGLDHLHNGLQKPVIHGNLQSKNILLGTDRQPHLSDFGMQLFLSPAAAQAILDASAMQGYKAPELIKMKEAGRETDIYSFGIILLEILTRRDAQSCRSLLPDGLNSGDLSFDLVNGRQDQSWDGEAAFRCYQLAVSCCSPLPALRPDIKHVIGKLEEIGRYGWDCR